MDEAFRSLSMKPFDRLDGGCVLCGKARAQVKKLILGVHGAVCVECVELSSELIRSEAQGADRQDAEESREIDR